MDPSCTIGFYCRTVQDFEKASEEITKVGVRAAAPLSAELRVCCVRVRQRTSSAVPSRLLPLSQSGEIWIVFHSGCFYQYVKLGIMGSVRGCGQRGRAAPRGGTIEVRILLSCPAPGSAFQKALKSPGRNFFFLTEVFDRVKIVYYLLLA